MKIIINLPDYDCPDQEITTGHVSILALNGNAAQVSVHGSTNPEDLGWGMANLVRTLTKGRPEVLRSIIRHNFMHLIGKE